MKVYSVAQNYYPNYYPAARQNTRPANELLHQNKQNEVNFTGFRFNYNGLLIKYIKLRSLRTSIHASKRPYLSINKNLKDIVNPVRIKVNPLEEIEAWDINPKNSNKYIIFLHGFSQNITNNQPLYEALTKTDYGVLAIDYRGYGKNRKTINIKESNMNEDVNAARKYLKDKGIEHIGLVGHSFGGYLASKNSRTNLYDFQILISPMMSLQFWLDNVLKHPKKYRNETFLINYVPNFKDQYRKVFRLNRNIANNSTPTYIIHSKTDRYIKSKDVENFAQRLSILKDFKILDRGGHKMDEFKINAIVDIVNNLS